MGFITNALGATSTYQAQGPSAGQLSDANAQNQAALGQQQGFATAATAQNGLGNQANVFAQQQALAGQLQAQSMGQGPNPAQAQLAQNTGNNIASQASLAAGQRGASANAGLIARQVGQQGAATQQQSVGQAATLQAQQQIAAQQQLAAQQQAMQGVAAQQVGQQANAIGNVSTLSQGNYGQLLGAQGAEQTINSGVAQNNAKTIGGFIGQGLGAAGTALTGVPGKADGGMITGGPKSRAGQHFAAFKAGGPVPGKAQVAGDSSKNDTVLAKLSPGEIVIPRSAASDPDKAAAFARQVAMRNRK